MKVFKSSNSTEVKMVTSITLIIFALVLFTLFFGGITELSTSLKIITLLIMLFGMVYFYSNALKQIELSENKLIMRKNIGQKTIDFQQIESINKVEFSNLTSTISSKGFFGFNGSLMDDTTTLVNDRSKMVKISTTGKNYLLSVDKPDELISAFDHKKNRG